MMDMYSHFPSVRPAVISDSVHLAGYELDVLRIFNRDRAELTLEHLAGGNETLLPFLAPDTMLYFLPRLMELCLTHLAAAYSLFDEMHSFCLPPEARWVRLLTLDQRQVIREFLWEYATQVSGPWDVDGVEL